MIDFKRDGYYVVRPEHADWADIEFTPATSTLDYRAIKRVVPGTLELVTLAEGGYRRHEGGPFGFVMDPIGAEADAYIDEDYMRGGLPPNLLATQLASAHGCKHIGGGAIRGNMIVICGRAKER